MGGYRAAAKRERAWRGITYVVARDRPGLYRYLTQHFSDTEGVRVILDRRHGERRLWNEPRRPERRRGERRRLIPDDYLHSLGYLVAH